MTATNNQRHLHYDLRNIVDPVLRCGIHGLQRYLVYGSKNRSRYPATRQTPTFKWESDGLHTIDIWFEDADRDLDPLIENKLGDLREGVAISPGYETDPKKHAFYMTVQAHRAHTQIFTPGSAVGARNCRSLAGSYGGVTPPGKKAKKGGRPIIEGIKKMYPEFDGDQLIYTVSCAVQANSKEDAPQPIEWNLTPQTLVREITLDGKTTALRKPVTLHTDIMGAHHPQFLRWNNFPVSPFPKNLSEDEKLARTLAYNFVALGYAFTGIPGPSIMGVGLDLDTFKQFNEALDQHCRAVTPNSRFATTIEGNPRLAAFCLLGLLGLPRNRTYNLVFVGPAGPSHCYCQANENSGSDTYDRLFTAINHISLKNPPDANGLFWSLRRHLLVEPVGDKDTGTSLYESIYESIENGWRWCQGFSALLIPGKDEKTAYRNRFPKILTNLCFLLGNDMERRIMDEMGYLVYCLAMQYQADGYGKDPKKGYWPRAKEKFRNILIRAHDKTSLQRAIMEMSDLVKRSFSQEVLDYLHSEKNIQLSISILAQGIWAYRATKNSATTQAAPAGNPAVIAASIQGLPDPSDDPDDGNLDDENETTETHNDPED